MPESKEFHSLICVVWRFNGLCALNLVPAHFVWYSQLMHWESLWTGNLETSPVWLWLHICCIPSVTCFWDLWFLCQLLVLRLHWTCDHPCCPAYSLFQTLFRVCGTRPTHDIQDRQTSHSYSDLVIVSLSFFIPFLEVSNTNFFPVSEQWADIFTQLSIVTPRSQVWSGNNHLGAHIIV